MICVGIGLKPTQKKFMKKNLLFLFCLLIFSRCSHEIIPGQLQAGPKAQNPEAVIAGTVDIKSGLKMTGSGTLFIIARPKGQSEGPPLAVKRIEDPVLPIGFQMSQANVMIPTNHFEGEITLTAKWSQSGTPMQDTDGDLSGKLSDVVKVGTKDVTLILDTRL
jgi:hypothetical protein